ncbi:hypothetical protein D3C80_1349030 [compost metagenome]
MSVGQLLLQRCAMCRRHWRCLARIKQLPAQRQRLLVLVLQRNLVDTQLNLLRLEPGHAFVITTAIEPGIFLQCLILQRQCGLPGLEPQQCLRFAVQAHADAGTGRVEQVDGFVGQAATCQVAT